ncbi:MAG: hypothetical protein KJZ75_03985 [Hyphomonadaceae bacterium]|nr:hypothetical protein [Hyphomonadaceae bacterium]GIK48318.1 MAG: acetyl-CoA carboxylase biotin carboxylase subunit [Alphaproteobacteria bacterium]
MSASRLQIKAPIRAVLVANRGEIAVRIIRACRELGIRAIAVHSAADAGAFWTRMADDARDIGPAAAAQSYLNIEAIVAAAGAAGADAVHPGYGLLSESPIFAQAVRDAGLRFIGPSPSAIAIMADKVTARKAATDAGLPVLPGTESTVESIAEGLKAAPAIGWPIAVKASFGGGGRGMRVAQSESDLEAAMEQASREAAAAFGRAEIYLERYLPKPRHIEVQILADSRGGVIHLGDRDCSVQRRHQKLLEEAPAPALPDGLRQRIADASVRLARSVGYESAGTVEFLADIANDAFYFLEMNTRLQVEHGITELVTGVDIVREQIAIAAGELLSLHQQDVVVRGHAIQARIAAEDAWDGFRPSPGRIEALRLPQGPGVRLDFGVEAHDEIPGHYDSMFGKIQALAATRDEARLRLGVALDDFMVAGVPTTASYLRILLDQPSFAAVTHDTGSLEREWRPDPAKRPTPTLAAVTAAPSAPAYSERRIAAPWGGRLIEVAVFGRVDNGAAAAASGNARPNRELAGAVIGGPDVTAPMDASVNAIPVKLGDTVAKGAPLVILEAMKMEVIVSAQRDGLVSVIHVAPGDAVKIGATLLTLSEA